MDDKNTGTAAWLTFSLAFDGAARQCQNLRLSGLSAEEIGTLLCRCLSDPGQTRHTLLTKLLTSQELGALHDPVLHDRVLQAFEWAESDASNHLLALDDPLYPALLRDTPDAPPLLYAKGDLSALNYPALAIVGARKASRAAIEHTHRLAATLAEKNMTIVSGLARGVDAAAHHGALSVGGRTIAVAATEPESVYPKHHTALATRISNNGGLILTEYPLGAATLRWYFPRRNRIISGLSLGVLVAEAGLPSGTLTTATHAMNQGREVMAMPGLISNPLARGCHALIKQGAALVESEQDILDTLAWPIAHQLEMNLDQAAHIPTRQQNDEPVPISCELESRTISALAASPLTLDELLEQLDCDLQLLSAMLGRLEINGRIARGPPLVRELSTAKAPGPQ